MVVTTTRRPQRTLRDHVILALTLTCAFAIQARAVLPFDLSTNGSAIINNGSWVGNGTVQANLSAGNFDVDGLDIDTLVQDFSAGTFTINPGHIYPPDRISSTLGASLSVSLTGGTGDFEIANSNSLDGGNLMYDSVVLRDLAGVTAINMTLMFTNPIAGRTDNTTPLGSRPIGGAVGIISPSPTLTASEINVTMQFLGVYSSSVADGPFVAGVPVGAIPFYSAAWDTYDPEQNLFTSDGFSGLITTLGQDDTDLLLVRGYDFNGSGNGYTAADAPLVYITGMTWTITPDAGNTFAADTAFTVSMDGQQHGNLNVVPEPSTVLFAGLASLGVVFGRRRRFPR